MATLPRIIYIDTLISLAVLSFTMDYLLLWATSKVTKVARGVVGLSLGALVGTGYFILYYLSARGILPYYAWLRFWPVILATSICMVIVAFYPISWRPLLRVTGFFYFIAVSSGGAGVAAGYALGLGVIGQLLVSIAAILIMAELGWGVVQKSLWQRLYNIPLGIELFGERVQVLALLDTGNRLREPLRGAQVIVVEHSAMAHLLPRHLQDVMQRMERGDLSEISRLLTSARLSSRFRVIPYASLGNENGLLVGIRPDDVWVEFEGRRITLENIVVGISPNDLDPDGSYRALIHPELLETALEAGNPNQHSASSKEGESAHVSTLG